MLSIHLFSAVVAFAAIQTPFSNSTAVAPIELDCGFGGSEGDRGPADGGVPREVRQSVRRGELRIRRRRHPSERDARAAHPGARHAEDEAGSQSAAEAREHPVVTREARVTWTA